MKKTIFILMLCVCFAACEKPGDCVKSAGTTSTIDYAGLEFNSILVKRGIAMVITQGDVYSVTVQAGENLVNDIEVKVSNGMLMLEDHTTCNWVRDYGQTVVYVTAPNITAIYSKTELDITSNGTLTYPDLQIFAMDIYDGYPGSGTGNYNLQIDNAHLTVQCNTVAQFSLSGHTQQADYSIYEYGGKISAQELTAEIVQFYHRGTNDMYVHPVQLLGGNLFNIGNVYCVTRPPQVEVTQHYQGRLIYY